MKLYTPPEMSKKLLALGCTSQSNLYWYKQFPHEKYRDIYLRPDDPLALAFNGSIPAFEFEDFAGNHEQANKNCQLVWPDDGDIVFRTEQKCSVRYSKNWVEEVERGFKLRKHSRK